MSDEQVGESPILTDDQIYAMALSDWLGLLESLWHAIGKPVDKKRLSIYAHDLGEVPFEILDRAIKRIRRENTYSVVPTIGELWSAINRELVNDNSTTPADWIERRWNLFLNNARFTQVIDQ